MRACGSSSLQREDPVNMKITHSPDVTDLALFTSLSTLLEVSVLPRASPVLYLTDCNMIPEEIFMATQ